MPTDAVNKNTHWMMLALLSAGFVALTLNWFDVATSFPEIGKEFGVGLSELSLLISVFLAGYGLAHIPGGMLATAIGMRSTLTIGLLIQGIAGILSGSAPNYTALFWFRILSGVGGSIFIAVAFGAVIAWFHDRQVTLALGISGGAAFSAGAAFALYVWVYLQDATSWRTSLVLAGIFELLVAAATFAWFRVPRGAKELSGSSFDMNSLKIAIGSRDLWIYGIALIGGYGAYFTVSQLFSGYAVAERGFNTSLGGLLAALIVLAGIPGSVLGGYLADRGNNIRIFVVGSLIIEAILLVLIPVVPTPVLWVLGLGIGFFLIFGFAAWSSVPSRVVKIPHHHVGTATGLMLTLAAVGGYFVPEMFGHLVPRTNYSTGWYVLGIISFAFALVGLLGRDADPLTSETQDSAGSATREHTTTPETTV